MPRALNPLRKLKSKRPPPREPAAQIPTPSTPTTPRHGRDHGRFAAGDRVFAIHDSKSRLLPPLCVDFETQVYGCVLRHNDIIGQPLGRPRIAKFKDKKVNISYPALDEYISKSPRLVQPIYARYASTIVDLLDIHVAPPGLTSQRVEVLDAGTGHGSLALHLAKAIAAANPPPPDLPVTQVQAEFARVWAKYRDRRNAIVHSVERLAANSLHAEKTILGFRQGLYWPHIDFYTARVEEWARQQYADRGSFLSHATLDLPEVHGVITAVSRVLKVDGKLIVFTPSITQIAECQRVILEKNLPLHLVRVVELGEGISTGRIWDLRFVTPRAREKAQANSIDSTSDAEAADVNSSPSTAEELASFPDDRATTGKVLICRPKVGDRIVGGGFVGLFRKTSFGSTEASGVVQRFKSGGDNPNQPETTTVEGLSQSLGKNEATTQSEPVEISSKDTLTVDLMPGHVSNSLSASTSLKSDDNPLISAKELLDSVLVLDAASFVQLVLTAIGHRTRQVWAAESYLRANRRRGMVRHYGMYQSIDTLFDIDIPFPYPDLCRTVEIAAYRTHGLSADLAVILLVGSLRILQKIRDDSNGNLKEKQDLNDKMITIQYFAWENFNDRLGIQRYIARKMSNDVTSSLRTYATFPSTKDLNAYWNDIAVPTTAKQTVKERSTPGTIYAWPVIGNIGNSPDGGIKDLQDPADTSSPSAGTTSGARRVKVKLDTIGRPYPGDETTQPFWTTLSESEAPILDLMPRSEKKENPKEIQDQKSGPYE